MTSRCIKTSRQEDNKILITANILDCVHAAAASKKYTADSVLQLALVPENFALNGEE
jgi:hypothetical protein